MARSIFTPLTINAGGSIITSDSATTPLILSGASGQAADLQQWRSATAGTLSKMGSQGNLVIGGTSTLGMLSVYSDGTTRIGQVIRGYSGQTADLQQWQNSAGTVLASINSAGLPTFTRILSINQTNSGETPLRITGASGQSVDLQQWRNSSATVLAKIDQNGFLVAGGATVLSNAVISSSIYGTTQVGIAVRGTAGQTANLQEWQTSTPTTVASISSAGAISTSSTVTATGDISTSGKLNVNASSGDEGGEIFLNKAVTNTTINGGVTIDVYQNKLRFFEQGGTARGFYIDITTGGAGVGTNLVSGGGSFTGGTLTSNLTLAAGTTSLSPLTFQSGTNLTTVTSGVREYDGTVFYSTSNTNPGRALDTQTYYYASNSDYGPDFSVSGAAQSMLGGATTGITVAAGTTYEFEFYTTVQHQYVTVTGLTGTYNITSSTVSGSPTVAFVQNVDYGSNTTNFTTATTLSRVRTTTSVVFSAAISSGSRYNFLQARGVIRVTGTGTAKIYPSLATSQVGASDNVWTVKSGTVFKLTPIGNGTATTVGTWA